MKGKIHHFRLFHGSKILFLCTIFLLLFNISTPHEIPISVARRVSDIADDFRHHRQLLSYNGDPLATDPRLKFENPRLKNAYIALQAWKEAILSDPKNITANWVLISTTETLRGTSHMN
ncbi:hypothetical protein Pfo_024927 [Paulownia fortunei]|nr:hypothetical protein Pfo_024927 [Paulownia fortunei]